MRPRNKSKILESLWFRCGRKCVNCGERVEIVHFVVPLGWIEMKDGWVVSPAGDLVRIATIEHLVPQAKGGGWDRKNLTLFCWHCNQKTSHWGQPLAEPRENSCGIHDQMECSRDGPGTAEFGDLSEST